MGDCSICSLNIKTNRYNHKAKAMPSVANQVTRKPVTVKRVYEKPERSDGTRVLVDRLWPRGLSKARAAVDQWLRELAPSDALRQWFHAHPEAWQVFRKRYLKE